MDLAGQGTAQASWLARIQGAWTSLGCPHPGLLNAAGQAHLSPPAPANSLVHRARPVRRTSQTSQTSQTSNLSPLIPPAAHAKTACPPVPNSRALHHLPSQHSSPSPSSPPLALFIYPARRRNTHTTVQALSPLPAPPNHHLSTASEHAFLPGVHLTIRRAAFHGSRRLASAHPPRVQRQFPVFTRSPRPPRGPVTSQTTPSQL